MNQRGRGWLQSHGFSLRNSGWCYWESQTQQQFAPGEGGQIHCSQWILKKASHDHPNTCSRDNPLCFARYTGDRIRICLLVCAVWSVRHNRKIFSSIIGCIISLVDPPHDDIQSSADMVTYTFAVESVVKRNLTEFVEVVSPISGASCWFGYVAKPESHMAITMYLNDHHNYQSGYC